MGRRRPADSSPAEPIYTLGLTERQLYHLREAFEASFTEPESKNEHERAVTGKLDRLCLRAYRNRKDQIRTDREG